MKNGKATNPKATRSAPRHTEHNEKGAKANPFGQRPVKADLVARLKAAAVEAKKE